MLELTIVWLVATVLGAASASTTIYLMRVRPLARKIRGMQMDEIEDYANYGS
jgi:hypothetical protein